MNPNKIKCNKCNRDFYVDSFYLDKNKNPMHKCKKCMAMMVDLDSKSTILPILKEIDIPYIPAEWDSLVDRYAYDKEGKRNPNANQSVLGRYIGKMKLKQYLPYDYSDSEAFIEKAEQDDEQTQESLLTELGRLMKGGVDPQKAWNIANGLEYELKSDTRPLLEKDQKFKLRTKWGDVFEDEELVKMETFYTEMLMVYDIITPSHEDYLKQICKISLRMNSSLDMGDYDSYKKLSDAYDKMMKSAKFTASQEKEEEVFIDSLSMMVRLSEEVGFIPLYHTSEPQDIVDETLKDMNTYMYDLVTTELNLGELIEDAIQQIKTEEEKDKEIEIEESDLYDDDEIIPLSDEELINSEVDY